MITAAVGAVTGLVLGVAAVVRKPASISSWCFLLGMAALGTENALAAIALAANDLEQMVAWLGLATVGKALIPGAWLAFSLAYSRGNAREFLSRWRLPLAAAIVLPISVAIGFRGELVSLIPIDQPEGGRVIVLNPPAKFLSGMLLLASIFVLVNLEKTIRAAVGTERWRVKYLFLGLGMIFGARIYTESQILLYSAFNPSVVTVDFAALLIGCLLIAIAYLRDGFSELDIYPSRAVLQGSLTILVAGAYLTIVGILAQVVARVGWQNFPIQAFIVLLGILGLTVLLLSDRLRIGLRRAVTRHFGRPEHDFREVWTSFTRRTFNVLDAPGLCRVSSELISETFNVLTVEAFLIDEAKSQLVKIASTGQSGEQAGGEQSVAIESDMMLALQSKRGPFDLDQEEGDWAEVLREATPVQFRHGGHRFVVPLATGSGLLGLLVLADRVNGVPYSQEDHELVGCIADQLAAALQNRNLTEEVMLAKELEAFQTMSTFFVHDLKNAANSLTLMLENLPEHFDDPEFRKDTLRGIGVTVDRINSMIQRLGALRQKPEMRPEDCDLNALVEEALANWDGLGSEVKLVRELQPLPRVNLDPIQMESVVTNLVVNAREATGPGGTVRVETVSRNGEVLLVVEDDGCGMSPEFVKKLLFRPFSSTKSKGLGIGMFQSKMIVEAHAGTIRIESEVGRGTKFLVSLPS